MVNVIIKGRDFPLVNEHKDLGSRLYKLLSIALKFKSLQLTINNNVCTAYLFVSKRNIELPDCEVVITISNDK